MAGLKRKTMRLSQPNPLFEKWLEEWKDEAASKHSDTQFAFAKALISLRKYPLPLNTGRECMILKHFGTRICLLLDRKLASYKANQANAPISDLSPKEDSSKSKKPFEHDKDTNKPQSKNTSGDCHSSQSTNVAVKDKRDKKEKQASKSSSTKKSEKIYIPAMRSAAYGVLVALNTHLNTSGPPGEMTKEELQKASQPFCDTSMLKPLPGSRYSGWSCVGQLINKGLVQRKGRPHRFSLTQDGINLAEKLPVIDMDSPEHLSQASGSVINAVSTVPNKRVKSNKTVSNTVNKKDLGNSQTLPSSASSDNVLRDNESQSQSSTVTSCNTNSEQIILLQNQFDIILLIDTQEIHKGDELVKAVQYQGVNVEVRNLKVGDFAWISRNAEGHELILPYIIERKRLDDLASSIKDGRFHEQKFRMKQSGIPNCMYLVEGHGQRQFSLPLPTLLQAAVNTQFIDRFTVKYTENLHESVVYLSNFTKVITRKFSDKTLLGCQKQELPEFNIEDDCISLMSFKEFNKFSSKTKKYCVKEMFIKQLVQLRGLSVEKAIAIVERYPSPRSLATAFQNEGNDKFIADITVGNLKRKFGPTISKMVYELYTKSILT